MSIDLRDRQIKDRDIFQAHLPQFGGEESQGGLNRRPKLLFLARPFPPLRVTACVRTWNIVKYLSRLGWDVTVVTPTPSVWRNLENPDALDGALEKAGIRRILTGHRWRCLEAENLLCWNTGLGRLAGGILRKLVWWMGIYKGGLGWSGPAERACSTLTAKDVDVILATGSPFVAFSLAKRLSERLGCPFILDYRDPWTGNPHGEFQVDPKATQEEARLLADCGGVTIVSRSWGTALDTRFNLGEKLNIVTNGYDPEELEKIESCNFGHFAIVYTGNFYPPKRVITPIMAAIKRLKDIPQNSLKREWYFHYYGGQGDHVRTEANRFGVLDRVIVHGLVTRSEALSAIRGAGVAVVITSVSEKVSEGDMGIVTGKLFDHLGLGVPSLVIAPPGSDVDAMAENTDLVNCFPGVDTDGITSYLLDVMVKNNFEYDPESVAPYAWPSIVKGLDRVLRGVIAVQSPNAIDPLP